MATTRAYKVITLTLYGTGIALNISVGKLIKFKQIGASDTIITYINQRGRLVTARVTESVSTVHALTETNALTGVYLFQAITLVGGMVVYVSNERVISVDQQAVNASMSVDEFVNQTEVYTFSSPSAAAFQAASGTLFPVTTQATTSIPSHTLHINNLKVDIISPDGTGSNILYDSHDTEFKILKVTESPAAVIALIGLL